MRTIFNECFQVSRYSTYIHDIGFVLVLDSVALKDEGYRRGPDDAIQDHLVTHMQIQLYSKQTSIHCWRLQSHRICLARCLRHWTSVSFALPEVWPVLLILWGTGLGLHLFCEWEATTVLSLLSLFGTDWFEALFARWPEIWETWHIVYKISDLLWWFIVKLRCFAFNFWTHNNCRTS